MSNAVTVENKGGVAFVELRNPSRFNAMSQSMWRQLRSVFQNVQLDASVRCAVVFGADHFCAGGDISEYPSFRFNKDDLRRFHDDDVWGGLQAMLDCDVPIVAQIAGNCMGAGVEIASCCDIRFAADTARFGAPIARLGFPMAPREAALVMRSVGELTAREMLLCAQVLDASTMHQRGFLNHVVPTADLASAVTAAAERIQMLAPQAARLNKQTFRALAQVMQAQEAMNFVATAYDYADSQEHREGITAFLEKRAPTFIP